MSDLAARLAVLQNELEEARERIRLLEAELGMTASVPVSFRLTGSEARVLGVIMTRPLATHSAAMIALYGDRIADDDAAEPKIVDVFVCKMRAKLKPFGVKIETVWGQGWTMSAESKAIVRELLGREADEDGADP